MAWPLVAGAAIGAIGGAMGRDSNKNLTSTGQTGGTNQSQSTWSPHSAAAPGYGFLAGNMMNMGQRPVPYFPGQTYVSPSGLTQQGVQYGVEGVNAMRPLLEQANQNYGFLSTAADIANNPYVQNMLGTQRQQTNQALSEEWLPQLQSQGQSAMNMGSSRQGVAQGQAVGRAANQLTNAQNQMMLGAYGQGLGAQQSALGMTPMMQQAFMAPSQYMSGLGQQVEGYQGRALQDAMARFRHQYQEPYQRQQQMMNILGALQPMGTQYGSGMNQGTTSSTSPNPNYQSMGQAMMGGAMSGAGMGGMFSDRRLKKNIERVGQTRAGYPFYSFEYLNGEPGLGVMSDEVPDEWVFKHASGFDVVDYARVR